MAEPYSIVSFAESLDVSRCKIQNTPDFIFLCGGPIVSTGDIKSARDLFHRHLWDEKPDLAARVQLAETASDWFKKEWAKQVFPDLLELERYLVHLASLTVLFVESPGSIAELGAFVASDDLRPKTLFVLNEFFGSAGTFITDGLVRKVRADDPELIFYSNWDHTALNTSPTRDVLSALFREIADLIETRDRGRHRTAKLSADDIGHTLLLLADLVRMGGVLERNQILQCAEILTLGLSREAVDRHLAMLQCVGLVKKRPYASKEFLLENYRTPFVQYGFKDNTLVTDSWRIRDDIRRSLKDPLRRLLKNHLDASSPNV